MNLQPWRNADSETKYQALVMAVIHVLLLGLNLWFYIFRAYDISEMIDGEALPAHARLALGIGHALRANIHFLPPILLCLLWLDGWVYLHFRSTLGKVSAALWNIGIVCLLLFCAYYFVEGMNTQLRRVEEVYVRPK